MAKSDGNLRPWRQIAQELAEERDPNKVTLLAKELTEALDAQGPSLDLRPLDPADADGLPKKI